MSMNNAQNHQMTRLCVLNTVAFCAALICYASSSAAADRPFSFRDAEYYMNDDDAMSSAEAFVTRQLPPGLAKGEAIARLARAGLDCGRPKADAALTCSFGSIKDTWIVRLTFDDRGGVSNAHVDHKIIGWASN